MRRLTILLTVAWGGLALSQTDAAEMAAADDFTSTVANALRQRWGVVDPAFTNYLNRCAAQGSNTELALSAHLIRGYSCLAQYENTMDETCLAAAFQATTNALTSQAATPDKWQSWHAHTLLVSCLNTANDPQGGYAAASNAWALISNAGFVDSTNALSRALLRYYKMPDSATVKEMIALLTALDAGATGRTNEVHRMKAHLSPELAQQLDGFLKQPEGN